MQITNLLVSLVLATAVVAQGGRGGGQGGRGGRGNSTRVPSEKALCREIGFLGKLVKLAANDTKLASKTRNNTARITEIKAKAAEAQTKLTELEKNATLTTNCAVRASVKKTENQCRQLKVLPKLIAFAANGTVKDNKGRGNATARAEKLKAKVAKAQLKLDGLKANTTLAATCADLEAKFNAAKAAKAAERAQRKGGRQGQGQGRQGQGQGRPAQGGAPTAILTNVVAPTAIQSAIASSKPSSTAAPLN